MKKYSEVRIDYFDPRNGVWCVDGWLTASDDEGGRTIAYITEDKKVLYCDPDARVCEVAQSAIAEWLATMQQEFFNVLRVSRDDVAAVGFNGNSLSDEEMKNIAYRIHNNNACIMDAFWEALRQVCENESIPKLCGYSIRLIDAPVSLPDEIHIKYDSFDDAMNALSEFVHSFDGKMSVSGAVYSLDDNEEDIDYCTSIL